MPDATLAFDHVHLVSQNPHEAASWYVQKLGGEVTRSLDLRGAPQIYVSLGGFIVIIRGQRTAETANDKPGLQWGVNHFGVRIDGDFDAYCKTLKDRGVAFSMEPTDFNMSTRIAFIQAPDGVSIELLNRKNAE